MVNLLWCTTDNEHFKVGVTVRWRLSGNLHKCSRLLVNCLDILPTSANYQATFMSGNRECHFTTRWSPWSLTSAPSSATLLHARALGSRWTTPQTLQQVPNNPGCMVTPVWWTHDVCYLIGTSPIILFKLYPDTSIILNFLNHLTVASNHHPHRMPWDRESAQSRE